MRTMIWMGMIFALVALPSLGRSDESMPPGAEVAPVAVNSQDSLSEVVGQGFRDQAWEYPAGLLPDTFPGFAYVSGPGDSGLSPKGRWRKPLVLKAKASEVQVNINCYRRREANGADDGGGTPVATLSEPDYQYQKHKFHGLRAAAASQEGRNVLVFREGDLLFKIVAHGESAMSRQEALDASADAIWRFRHPS